MKKNTRNSIIGGAVIAGFASTLNPIISTTAKDLISKCKYQICINPYASFIKNGIEKNFKNIPGNLNLKYDEENGFKLNFEKNLGEYSQYIGIPRIKSTIIYHGYPITLEINSDRGVDCNKQNPNTITLSTLNLKSAKDNLQKFIHECFELQRSKDIEKMNSNVFVYSSSWDQKLQINCLDGFKKRTFNDIFLPDEIEKRIKESLDMFISKRDWYKENNIPYHFGFLLSSEPGHGKSSLVQAMAKYINATLYVIPGDYISDLPKLLERDIRRNSIDPSTYRIVCIEDIDCGFAEAKIESSWDENNSTEKVTKRKVGLAEILNCFDGLNAPENVIYVMTTNHAEKLDCALIRPGRCDVKIEIPGITKETLIKFCKQHFKSYDDTTIENKINNISNFKECITFAELQTEVMKSKSLEKICEFVTDNTKSS